FRLEFGKLLEAGVELTKLISSKAQCKVLETFQSKASSKLIVRLRANKQLTSKCALLDRNAQKLIEDDIPRYTGSMQLVVADLPGISQKLKLQFITFPNGDEVLGFIDGTHIKIRNPGGEYPEIFRNSLGVFSFNCQHIKADLQAASVNHFRLESVNLIKTSKYEALPFKIFGRTRIDCDWTKLYEHFLFTTLSYFLKTGPVRITQFYEVRCNNLTYLIYLPDNVNSHHKISLNWVWKLKSLMIHPSIVILPK
ncbi:hypothetical protein L9F63_010947, partial [Diploptera punctata]